MAVRTFRLMNSLHASGWQDADETDKTAANATPGWIIGKSAAAQCAPFAAGVKQINATFTSTLRPDGLTGPVTATKDCILLTDAGAAWNGSFAATAWTFNLVTRDATATAGTYRYRIRVWAATNTAGTTGVRELTSAVLVSATVNSSVSTTVDGICSPTWSPGAITLTNEYLFVQVGLEIVVAGGVTNGDAVFRVGAASGNTGTNIVTPNWTATTATNLTVANAAHGVTDTEPQPITQDHFLAVDAAAHAHAGEAPTLTVPSGGGGPITAANAFNGFDDNTGLGNSFSTSSYAFQNNKLYLLAVATRGNTATVSAVTGGGLTWVLVGEYPVGGGTVYLAVWRGLVTSGASTGALSITTTATPTAVKWLVDEFGGVDTSGSNGSGAIVQSSIANGGGSPPSHITLASFGDAVNNAAWAVWTHAAGEATTMEAGYTTLADVAGTTSPVTSVASEFKLGQDLDVTATWATTQTWRAVGVEIKQGAGGAAPTDLVVADGSHGHTAEAPGTMSGGSDLVVQGANHLDRAGALDMQPPGLNDVVPITQVHVLTVDAALHAHAGETPPTMSGGSPVVVQDAAHAHTADVPTLVQQHVLVVDAAAHAHAAEAPVLSVATALVVADGTHAHTAEVPTLTQQHVLALQDATEAHTADVPLLVQQHVLVAQGASHSLVSDSPGAMVQNSVLVPQDAAHAHTAEAPALVQNSSLVVQAATHAHVADSPVVVGNSSLAVADGSHAHTSDVPVVVGNGSLVVADAFHALTSDTPPALSGGSPVVVQDAFHGHTADTPTPGLPGALVVADGAHAVTSDTPTLVQQHTLVVQDAAHAHTADAPPLVQNSTLVVAAALHAHTADAPTLVSNTFTLAPADGLHAVTSDVPTLTQQHTLVVQAAFHAQTSDTPNFSGGSAVIVANAVHATASDLVALVQQSTLVVADAVHAHTADGVVLVVPAIVLAPANGQHAHIANVVGLQLPGQGFKLEDATNILVGTVQVQRVYAGAVQDWPKV